MLPAKKLHTFVNYVLADHTVSQSAEAAGLTGERDALIFVDVYSKYFDAFPLASKSADDDFSTFSEYVGTCRPVEACVWSRFDAGNGNISFRP